ncbi:MAG TPA: energy transducer TonB [Pyrinomonadaceae bacterium]
MKHQIWFICLVITGLLISGCRREPQANSSSNSSQADNSSSASPLKVLSVNRADGVDKTRDGSSQETTHIVETAGRGRVFLMVTFELGQGIDPAEFSESFNKSSILTDKQGRPMIFLGDGYGKNRENNPSQIELTWSVPEEETSFKLTYAGQSIDINAPQIIERVGPPPLEPRVEQVPEIGSAPDYIPPSVIPKPVGPVHGGVVGGSPVAADEPPPPPPPAPTPAKIRAPISGGVLNGKAISLPKPPYPAIAKAARASGTVMVQVTIDESGKVISARAVSGHPLLQQAAVQAAYQARFTPTQLSGEPVKVTGIVTYNFVVQ